jgi:hypothetical protein
MGTPTGGQIRENIKSHTINSHTTRYSQFLTMVLARGTEVVIVRGDFTGYVGYIEYTGEPGADCAVVTSEDGHVHLMWTDVAELGAPAVIIGGWGAGTFGRIRTTDHPDFVCSVQCDDTMEHKDVLWSEFVALPKRKEPTWLRFGDRVIIDEGVHQGKIGTLVRPHDISKECGVAFDDRGAGWVHLLLTQVSPYPPCYQSLEEDFLANVSVAQDWVVGGRAHTRVLIENVAAAIAECKDTTMPDGTWMETLAARVIVLKQEADSVANVSVARDWVVYGGRAHIRVLLENLAASIAKSKDTISVPDEAWMDMLALRVRVLKQLIAEKENAM